LADETVRKTRLLVDFSADTWVHLAGVFFSTIIGGAFAFGVGLNMATDAFWDRWNKGVSVHQFPVSQDSRPLLVSIP
jgi:Ubiquinol-cytochrome C reductase, UQCRX/QCR9 like